MRFHPPLPPYISLDDPEAAVAYLRYVHERARDGEVPVLDTETQDKEGKPDPDEINGLYAVPIWLAVQLPSEVEKIRVAIPLRDERVIAAMAELLEDETITTSWHRAAYDYPACQNLGIEIRGRILDTLVLDEILHPETRNNRHSIDDISEDLFDIKLPKYKELYYNPDIAPVGGGKPTGKIADYSDHVAADYACSDTWRGALVMHHRRRELEESYLNEDKRPIGKLYTLADYYWQVEEPHLKTLFGMERRGAPINRPFMEDLSVRLKNEEQTCLARAYRLLGRNINVNSPKQMGELLFGDLGLMPVSKTKSGAWSTNNDTIENCLFQARGLVESGEMDADNPTAEIIENIVRAKDCGKTRSTFVDGILVRLDASDCIHTSYGLARTGRIRSYNPNLTNLPNVAKDEWVVRQGWYCPPGMAMCVADYSQVELRVLAVYADDPLMLGDIADGRDLHSASAARGLSVEYDDFVALKDAGDHDAVATRVAFKTVRFADVYGAEPKTLALQLSKALGKVVLEDEAISFRQQLRDLYPTVTQWIAETRAWSHESMYTTTILGRRRAIPFINSDKVWERERGERIAVNTAVQGSAADILKMSILTTDRDPELRELGWLLRMQIHDELVFIGPEEHATRAKERIVEIMEDPFRPLGLEVPVHLKVEAQICPNWAEGK